MTTRCQSKRDRKYNTDSIKRASILRGHRIHRKFPAVQRKGIDRFIIVLPCVGGKQYQIWNAFSNGVAVSSFFTYDRPLDIRACPIRATKTARKNNSLRPMPPRRTTCELANDVSARRPMQTGNTNAVSQLGLIHPAAAIEGAEQYGFRQPTK